MTPHRFHAFPGRTLVMHLGAPGASPDDLNRAFATVVKCWDLVVSPLKVDLALGCMTPDGHAVVERSPPVPYACIRKERSPTGRYLFPAFRDARVFDIARVTPHDVLGLLDSACKQQSPTAGLIVAPRSLHVDACSALLPPDSELTANGLRVVIDGVELVHPVEQDDAGVWLSGPGPVALTAPMTLHVEALGDACVMRAAIYWSTWWEHAPGRAMILPVIQRLAGFGWELDEASLGG